MNKRNIIFAGLALFLLVFSACQKQDKKDTVSAGSIPSNALKASTLTPALADSIKNNNAITFNWLSATFGNQVIATYILQIDIPSDTSGTNGWLNAKNFVIGANINTFNIDVQDLNTALIGVGMSAGVPGISVVRIKAEVININSGDQSASINPVYSNVLALTVIPYSLVLYVPSSSYGWNFAVAPTLNVFPDSTAKYEGYVYLPGTGIQYFKYTNSQSFNGVNYGDGGSGTLTTNGLAGAMSVPTGGYYEVTADFTKVPATWTATKTTWSVIGDATPGGWTTDTQLSYDSVNQVWTAIVQMVSTGSYKFRANDAWSIDFGVTAANYNVLSGYLTYADNPFFAYNGTLDNLAVPVSGTYKITLDLHISGTYTFNLVKQ